MTAVFLGDGFSLEEGLYLGRPIANRSLVKAIFLCDRIDRVLAVGDPRVYQDLDLPGQAAGKLVTIGSVGEIATSLQSNGVAAVFCSTFGKKYAQLVHFRNLNRLQCPIFGFTHTLSYQDEVGAIYRMFCAGVNGNDGILCTSQTAVDVMTRLIDNVRATISFKTDGPRLIHFPLAYEAQKLPIPASKDDAHFQIAYIGRLDWLTKADLLVIPRIAALLPKDQKIRFVIAGAADNPGYVRILQAACRDLPVRIEQNVSDAGKNRILAESHVLLSPADNYQETFGLSVLEAMHHGCVPVVSDFDGYRHLVADGRDGHLLKTYGARVPDVLWKAQILMPDTIYHGWWAAGVSIDPVQAAQVLQALAEDRGRWAAMSGAAIRTARDYGLDATAARFGDLIDRINGAGTMPADHDPRASLPVNPFHIDYSTTFGSHPTVFWSDEELALTDGGRRFLRHPDVRSVPQLNLLSNVIAVEEMLRLLDLIAHGATVQSCREAGIDEILCSIALKNNLITVAE